jgi:hypothetical protein
MPINYGLKNLFNWHKWSFDIPKRKQMKRFAEEHCFELNGCLGFTVNGLLVREFGYLLSYVTNNKHDSFVDFEEIANDFVAIDSAIVIETRKPVPREEEVHFTSHEGAIQNLKNLRYIVFCIKEYVDLAKELGLPTNPLRKC